MYHGSHHLISIGLGPEDVDRAVAVAASRGASLAAYLMGAIAAAAAVARPPTPAVVSALVAARISSDHDRLGPGGLPAAGETGDAFVVVSGPSLAARTRSIANHRGQPVGEYLDELYARVSPADGPMLPLPDIASQLANLIELDFAFAGLGGDE